LEFLIGIQRIPFTRYNICPRMRRACRKSSVVGIVVGALVAILIFVLSSYVNHLTAIRSEKYEKRVDSLIVHGQNVSSLNNALYKNKSLIDDSLHSGWPFMFDNLNHRHEKHTVLFIFLLTIIMIAIIFVCMCSSKFRTQSINRKTNIYKQGIPIPVDIFISAMTQTSVCV